MTGAHALPAGLRLGAYEIVSPLTSGGMAAVYLGRRVDPPASSYVAIKVVHPKFADEPQFVQMFLDEARLSSRIHHANVVRVEATGEAGGLYYMVMEYLHGAPLQLFVRRLAEKQRALKHEVIVNIVAAVAAGLHAAHETKDERGEPLGIVHRDVTPQNILISYGGGVKLIDFGIAKAAGRVHQTAKGLLKGKLRYMAPEQAAGRAVDRRTDVYALGIVLWEMLTYRKAFSARTDAELVRLVLAPKLPPPSRLNPGVAPELDGVALTALAPSPEERFQTALAFRNALLGAYPAAQRVDEAELASLLRTVLADELAKDARTLPPAVVVRQPLAIGQAQQEAALTVVVPSLEPDDEDHEKTPPPAAAPAPREPPRPAAAPVRGAPTAYGMGLAPAEPPPPHVAIAPVSAPSLAPPGVTTAATPGVSPATVIVGPQAPPGVHDIAQTRLALPPSAQVPPQAMAPAHAFTPPNASDRAVIAAQLDASKQARSAASRTKPRAPETPPPSAASRVLWGCGIALAVLGTILLGTVLGWLALHWLGTHGAVPGP